MFALSRNNIEFVIVWLVVSLVLVLVLCWDPSITLRRNKGGGEERLHNQVESGQDTFVRVSDDQDDKQLDAGLEIRRYYITRDL